MPESIHIGSITRFIRPETASIVLARLATSRPMPENISRPEQHQQHHRQHAAVIDDAEGIAREEEQR